MSPTRAPWRAPAIQGALVELKGGDQYVRVEHVHVNDGGQAVIGNVKSAGSGAAGAPEQSASGVIAPANQDR